MEDNDERGGGGGVGRGKVEWGMEEGWVRERGGEEEEREGGIEIKAHTE